MKVKTVIEKDNNTSWLEITNYAITEEVLIVSNDMLSLDGHDYEMELVRLRKLEKIREDILNLL